MSQFTRLGVFSALFLTLAATVAQAAPASGMLLGVYAFENFRGLRITGTIPGYSAEGRLYAGDVLLQATTDGSVIYSARSMGEFEWAKDQIGPGRPAALEVWRPGVGKIYFWVEFTPVGGGAQAYAFQNGGAQAAAPVKMKAQFKTEAERPGARALFNGGGQGGGNGGNGGFNGGGQMAPPPVAPGKGNPSSLFGK